MKFRLALLIAGLSLLLTACNFSLAADITPPPGYQSPTPAPTLGPLFPSAAPDPQNGRLLYVQNCAPCHGDSGLGDGPQGQQLPNPVAALGLPEVARSTSPAQWFQVVTQGNLDKFMPPFTSTMSDQERWDVVAYAMTLSTTSDQISQGQQLYQANCTECHGTDGEKVAVANFADQELMAKLSPADLFNAISKGSSNQKMPPFEDKLSQDERWALTAYLRTFSLVASQSVANSSESPTTSASASETATPAGTLEPSAPSANEGTPAAKTTATAESLGTVTGTISNGSGGSFPKGLTVTLHIYQQDQSGNFNPTNTLESEVSADGSYIFQGMETSAQYAYILTLEYEGVQYQSEPGFFSAGDNQVILPLTFYDTTTDASALTVDRWHIFFDFTDPNAIQAVEVFIISNPTMKTVIPAQDGQPVLTFPLPQGAQNLQFENGQLGGRYIQTANGFGDTTAVIPGSGQHQVLFAYNLPYNKKLDFSQQVDLPVDSAVVMTPLGVSAKSDLLQDGGTQDFQGVTYTIYTTQPLPSGAILNMTISGKPKTASAVVAGTDTHRNILIGVGAFGLVLVLAGVWLYWRERNHPVEGDDEPDEELDEFEDAESVMDAIIALDDLHRNGKIPEDAYQKRRAQLKAHLKELL